MRDDPTKRPFSRSGLPSPSVAKIRMIVARLDIQPRRFPDDMRKLYYSQEDIERMKQALGLK